MLYVEALALAIIVWLIIVCVFCVIATMRKPPLKKPRRYIKSFETTLRTDEVMKSIVNFAIRTGYRIENFDEKEGRIILSDGITLTSWGFFYPIFISKSDSGSTVVEVGVRGKASIVGTIAFRCQERVLNGIKGYIFARG